MAQYVAVRALNRSPRVRVINSAGKRDQLSTVVDTIVDLDDVTNRRELSRHGAIGQYIVTAANSADAATPLPANT
jgi:hypothetical protein